MNFFSRDVLVRWNDPWDEQARIEVMDLEHGFEFIEMREESASSPMKFESLSSPPKEDAVFVKPRRGTKDEVHFKAMQNRAEKFVADAPNSVVRLEKLLKHLEKVWPDKKFVEGCLRVLAGRGTIEISRAKTKKDAYDVRLSDSARVREKGRSFAASFAHELEESANRIAQIIGHGGVVGSYREDLLRILIQRHIPQRFHAATGFIEGNPKQLDIVIYDQIDYAPLFRADDLVVVPSEAVRAIIEVKSNLTTNELKEALDHLLQARPLALNGPPVFTGIIGYKGAQESSLLAAFKEFHSFDDDGFAENQVVMMDDMITAICVLKDCILLPMYSSSEDGSEIYPTISSIGNLSGRHSEAALFFDIMSRFLRYPRKGKRNDAGRGHLLDSDMIITGRDRVYAKNAKWQPYVDEAFLDELRQYVFQYENWLDGEAW